MKEIMKRTTAAALAGIMTVGMLTGCGEKKLDGTKTVATVNGTEIPMGVVSLYARQTQAQTEAMYKAYMGESVSGIWDQEAADEDGMTYGEQAVENSLEQVELMYIMKEKAADYGIEITEDEQNAIAEAAAQFIKDNDEETIETLAVTEDQVKTFLELETYREKIYHPILDEANVEVTDEEAQQSAFTYVNISISGDDLTEDDIAAKKEQAQSILDQMKEDPAADMSEIAKAEDESYSALSGTFFTNESDDETLTSSYPDEVVEALRGLKDGEVYSELIETDTSIYVVRLDKVKDEDATESKKESLKSTRENEYYSETTEKWLEDAKIDVDKKVLKTLQITDSHTFSFKAVEEEASEEEAAEEETSEEEAAEEETTEEEAAEEETTEEETAEEEAAE